MGILELLMNKTSQKWNIDKTCFLSIRWGFVTRLFICNVMEEMDNFCDKEHVHHGNKPSCLNDQYISNMMDSCYDTEHVHLRNKPSSIYVY